ncbi:N-acetylmuramoyl-L-alanine amidase [Vampirovibrio sp.]|uniref:N-acetylmuramoyl-L-alanine amidase family protein n=1 Tax=Vampirovibrio sp. TaxID=2717857 RepID=UPI0035930850
MKTLPGQDARIEVVYPHPEHLIYEDSTFLMGGIRHAPSGARLWINQTPVPVSKHGFFAWKVPIHTGMNPMRLEVRLNESTPPLAQALFALRGVPPLAVLPQRPLKFHEETILPQQDVWLTAEDTLMVACAASEGAQVSFTIPGWMETPVTVPPLLSGQPYLDTRDVIFAEKHWVSQRIPVQGYYQTQISVAELLKQSLPPAPWPENASILLHLKSEGQPSVQKSTPGRLTLLRQSKPAVVRQDRMVTRTTPPNGSRLSPQRLDTLLWVDGLDQGWARTRLSRDEVFYVPLEALAWLPTGAAHTPVSLASIKTRSLTATDSQIRLIFHSHPANACPVQVDSIPSERMDRLQVRLYGVCGQCDFIHYPPDDAVVRQIHWRQVAEQVLELWIDLRQPLAGYEYAWQDGEWQFTLRTLPRQIAEVKVLIDPGHGGTEWGSTGLNGLPEKNLNLTVSRLLRDALLQEGFQVSLTRNSDETVSLPARGDKVIATQPHVVLSLHHNALPDGRDPLQAKGACCFYYHAFSKPLAEQLLNGLTEPLAGYQPVPSYGLFYDSLYMTRIHQALAVLVEVGFFTNPDEFERLIQPEFQKQAAQRLASALRQFCLQA